MGSRERFDLNMFPLSDNSDDDGRENCTNDINEVEACNVEDDVGDVPIIIGSNSKGNLVIDFNVDMNQESGLPYLEVDVQELLHDVEDEDTMEAPHMGNSHKVQTRRRKKFIPNKKRWEIYNVLLARSVNGKLKRDTTIKEVSILYDVPIRTVQRIWKQAKDTPVGGSIDVSHRRTKNCGRKRIQLSQDQITSIPLHRRTTLRSFAVALGVSHVTLHRRLRQGLIRRHSNAIKPLLGEENKRVRLRFCIDMLDPNSIPRDPKFVNMYNVVHIDEKWFYMTKKSEKYYLHAAEDEPLRTCQSKNFIGKVMFLAVMARPKFDDNGNEVFSGKIGVFPFVTRQPAQRSSRNRVAGTIEIKPITSVKKDTVREYLIQKVIPAIQAKWPVEDSSKTIFIQQDNARTHIGANDEEFRIAASQNGFDIRIICQPPNSPDLNVLDLGFFNAIQSLQHKESPRTVGELIYAVEKSFDEFPANMENRVFATLQSSMLEIMKIGGFNKYHIPHMNKTALERLGCLPQQVTCDYSIVESAKNLLAYNFMFSFS